MIECENRFEALYDESEDSESETLKTVSQYTKNSKQKETITKEEKQKTPAEECIKIKGQPKLIILADSHGKNLGNLVQQRTNVNVCSYVRSGAKFHKVVEEVCTITESLTKEDHLLVIAGTNNVETTGIKHLLQNIKRLIKNSTETNLLLATVPMRHDAPELDYKITCINTQLENLAEENKNSFTLLPLHLLPRHLFTRHGLHMNRKGKERVAEMTVAALRKNKNMTDTTAPKAPNTTESTLNIKRTIKILPNQISVIDADMKEVIESYRNDPSTAFAHSISADCHMSAGVAVVFKRTFGRPSTSDFVSNKLTCQKLSNGATVYGLVTKAEFFGKPEDDYELAFKQLADNFKSKELKTLICSPMGCVRDLIEPSRFAQNIVEFRKNTGASIVIVCYNELHKKPLRRGLSHIAFMEKLNTEIKEAEKQAVELLLKQSFRNTAPENLSQLDCIVVEECFNKQDGSKVLENSDSQDTTMNDSIPEASTSTNVVSSRHEHLKNMESKILTLES